MALPSLPAGAGFKPPRAALVESVVFQASTQRQVLILSCQCRLTVEKGEIVSEISETQNTIAAVVEERNATTTEINRTVEATVEHNSTIGHVIGRVAETAVVNWQSGQSIKASATQLSAMTTRLQSSVSRFVTKASMPAS